MYTVTIYPQYNIIIWAFGKLARIEESYRKTQIPAQIAILIYCVYYDFPPSAYSFIFSITLANLNSHIKSW